MKKCPFCAEELEDAAVSCHHCQQDLPEEQPAGAPEAKIAPQISAYTFLGFVLLIANVLSIAVSSNLFSTKSSQIDRSASAAMSASSRQGDSVYFLPRDTRGKDASWGYSYDDPGLESDSPSNDAHTVGTWSDTGALPRKIVIIKLGSSYLMTSSYSNGSVETASLIAEDMDGEERLYEDTENMDGRYMVIRLNGNLAFYDAAGLIYELPSQ